MNSLFEFLAGPAGRIARIVAGIVLIVLGFWLLQGVWRWVLVIVGLAPLAAGLFDFCLFAPLFGLPFMGEPLRARLHQEPRR
jgi:hypothetical protein